MKSEFAYGPSTLVELLCERALYQPDQVAYTFLVDGEAEEVSLTYAELHHRAQIIAVLLQEFDIVGERVLLLYPPGLEYIAAFFGCLYAGALAVPAYPPRPNHPMARLQSIAANAQVKVVLGTQHVLSTLKRQPLTPDLANPIWRATDILVTTPTDNWRPPSLTAESLAFLQYTSGSTAQPKGVMLSHRALLHNLVAIHHSFEITSNSRGVIWLPPYHDMGLIGGLLQPLYGGFPVVCLSPVSFLQYPFRWLQAISRYKATISGGPNFAYELCMHKITAEQRATLDLSSWELAFCGAEPIRPATVEQFSEMFRVCGFRRDAFYPCYGLAEATLMVTGGSKSHLPITRFFDSAALERHKVMKVAEEHENARALVGCGHALKEQFLVIADPKTLTQCGREEIGEIWVSGPSVAQGYWDQPQATKEIFHAKIVDSGEARSYLRTGDVGFIRDGELFVTGRLKDLIIIRGRNLYPQDIELTVEGSNPAVRVGGGAAFSVEVAQIERLVIVQEIERHFMNAKLDLVINDIRSAVSQHHEVNVYDVVLVRPGSIPKTSSGKIQRYECCKAFLAGNLQTLKNSTLQKSSSPDDDSEDFSHETLIAASQEERKLVIEGYLQERIASKIKVARIHISKYAILSTMGVDSLMAAELSHQIELDLQVEIPLVTFLQDISIAELTMHILGLLTSENVTALLASSLQRGPEKREYLLSYAQQRLWFLYQLLPENPLYTIPIAVRLRGVLNVEALRKSVQEIIQRHESLRTTFPVVGGVPAQMIHPSFDLHFSLINLSENSQQAQEIQHSFNVEANHTFDLAAGPLLRLTLLLLSPHEHILILTMHHIISDAWSMRIFVHELALLYAAHVGDDPRIPLAAPPIRYVDFAHWQRQWLQGTMLNEQLSYWKQQLANAPPLLELPVDHPRPAVQSFRGGLHYFHISMALTQQIKVVSRQEGVTLFMLLLAAFQTLLYRYSGQNDLIIGTPVAYRTHPQLEGIIGFFVNTLVLRTDLSGNHSFKELLTRVRRVCLEAYSHQDVPFERLVEEMQHERDLSYNPLIQVVFQLQNVPMQALELTGLEEVTRLPMETGTAKFDLLMMLEETAQGLTGTIEYSTDLFDPSTSSRISEHYQRVLEEIVKASTCRLSDINLLTTVEQQQLLQGWNATTTAYPRTHSIHQLFEEQVKQGPEVIALTLQEEQITYGELNRRANQLAHYLQTLGVRSEARVGICVERSLEMVIALLAILKAGGYYVPLDPTFPRMRLALLLSDLEMTVLITQQTLWELLPESSIPIVCLEVEQERLQVQPEANLAEETDIENLAYSMYTSGSTGTPKGIGVTHHNVVRLVKNTNYVRFGAQEIFLQFAPLAFDASTFEIWGALLNGGRLVIFPPEMSSLAELGQAVVKTGITTLWLTASLFHQMVEMHLDCLLGVYQLLAGGDVLSVPHVCKILGEGGDRSVINGYGPTECTTFSCCYPMHRPEEVGISVPIGRPIANTQVYILDAYQQIVPVGIPGELYIGGDGLARAYLNQPALTAEHFVPHPFSQEPGVRLYRTGDIVRYTREGLIEFLGRVDNQVKLRGFRIELEEIENILRQQAELQDAAVIVREDTPGNKQLVAYIVARVAKEKLSDEKLRKLLQWQLPEYMVPSRFVQLEHLPITSNGKIDRKALPRPETTRHTPQLFVAPRTPLEETLADIWSEVLDIEQVSIHDNFFALGGHSLLATQLVSRFQEIFPMKLSLRDLFEAPTISGLARCIEANETIDLQVILKTAQIFLRLNRLSEEEIQLLLDERSDETIPQQ